MNVACDALNSWGSSTVIACALFIIGATSVCDLVGVPANVSPD
jgi:hypothetical protein